VEQQGRQELEMAQQQVEAVVLRQLEEPVEQVVGPQVLQLQVVTVVVTVQIKLMVVLTTVETEVLNKMVVVQTRSLVAVAVALDILAVEVVV
jgi:hypothetical protein